MDEKVLTEYLQSDTERRNLYKYLKDRKESGGDISIAIKTLGEAALNNTGIVRENAICLLRWISEEGFDITLAVSPLIKALKIMEKDEKEEYDGRYERSSIFYSLSSFLEYTRNKKTAAKLILDNLNELKFMENLLKIPEIDKGALEGLYYECELTLVGFFDKFGDKLISAGWKPLRNDNNRTEFYYQHGILKLTVYLHTYVLSYSVKDSRFMVLEISQTGGVTENFWFLYKEDDQLNSILDEIIALQDKITMDNAKNILSKVIKSASGALTMEYDGFISKID